MTSSFCTQLRLVLWKNWLIKKRKPIPSLVEMVLPVIAMVFLVLARHFKGITHVPTSYPVPIPLADNHLNDIWCDAGNYCDSPAPRLGVVRGGIPSEGQQLLLVATELANVTIKWFDTEDDMVAYVKQPNYNEDDNNPIPVGVVFTKWGANDGGQHHWAYTLRVRATDSPPTGDVMDTLVLNDATTWQTYYYTGAGFVLVQDMMDKFIMAMEQLNNKTAYNDAYSPVKTQIMTMMRTPYVKDDFQGIISNVLPFLLMFAYMYPFSRLVRELVEEKESRMKEAMKVMGLSDAIYWTSWGLTYLTVFGIQSLLSSFITTGSVFKYTNTGILILYFLSFSMAMIGFGFLISAFFSKAKLAGSISMFLFYVSFIPYQTLKSPGTPSWAKQLASLLASDAFALGSDILGTYEAAQVGVQFTNWDQPLQGYSFRDCIMFLLLDSVLYFVLAWYLDKVLPSEYGTRLSPMFIFSPAYWGFGSSDGDDAKKQQRREPSLQGMRPLAAETPEARLARASSRVEDVSPELMDDLELNERGVKVRGLSKAFDGSDGTCLAVDHLNLDMFYGQVFALLGHNGAGKTTTINMLIGMLEPTGGDALINGLSIHTDMRAIRHNMGFCPQHSILFGSLSVKEHLEFFCYLKGVSSDRIPHMVTEMIGKIGLTDKTHFQASALSGGMQRKLSVAIALIGDSKIVFLDEPSSGMDPASRRDTWNLIKEYQRDRVILLTTHFMDEADVLADRIAIMSHGRLRACGTSMYLKACYGVGYTFVISKEDGGRCDEARVMELVAEHVHNAEVISNVGTELTMRAPFSASKGFPKLFDAMEAERASLGVTNYGVSVTTLEEVFMKIASDEVSARTPDMKKAQEAGVDVYVTDDDDDDEEERKTTSAAALATPVTPGGNHYIRMRDKANGHADDDDAAVGGGGDDDERVKVLTKGGKKYGSINAPLLAQSHDTYEEVADRQRDPSFFTHFRALFIKRALYAKRDTKALVYQLLIPVIFLVLALSVMQIPVPSPPPLLFSTLPYGSPLNVPVRTLDNGSDVFSAAFVDGQSREVDVLNSHTIDDFSYDMFQSRNAFVDRPRMGGVYLAPSENATNSTLERDDYVIAFNITAYHSLPVYLNLGNQAMLRAGLGIHTARIETTNFPFPQNGQDKKNTAAGDGIIVSMMTIIAFAFIPASYGFFVVRERENKSKHQQLVSGVSINAYWTASYAWEVVNYMVPAVSAAVIILAFNNPDFVGENYGPTVLTFLLYGTSVISFTYLLSFMFDQAGSAQNWLLVIYFITGLALSIASFVLSIISSTKEVNKSLKFIYRLFPNFCLGDSLFQLSVRPFGAMFSGGTPESPWALDVTGYNMIFMALESVVYFLCVLMIEHGTTKRWWDACSRPVQAMDVPEDEDSDIVAARQSIQAGECDHDPIRIEGLRKVYPGSGGTGPVVAVRDLWMRVREGECLGYLGTNGAGKTTTMGMLTAEVHPTRGTAFLDGMSIIDEQREIRKRVGYCPQHDALFDLLTGREHLQMYARIKGIPEHELAQCVDKMLTQLTLQEYADRPAGKYSGGNKRKLSVAIALIGSPTLVFLDEPSSGVDPVSRRFMMDFIARTMKGRSVILTTHSMEECEALCQRIGIMVNGRLKCLGSPQHLKDKFAQGYQVDIRAAAGHVPEVKKFMSDMFEGAHVIEEHSVNLKFKLPPQQMTLGAIFGVLEDNRDTVHIKEYSVSQTTLEQVFLLLARQQEQERVAQQQMYMQQYMPVAAAPLQQVAIQQ